MYTSSVCHEHILIDSTRTMLFELLISILSQLEGVWGCMSVETTTYLFTRPQKTASKEEEQESKYSNANNAVFRSLFKPPADPNKVTANFLSPPYYFGFLSYHLLNDLGLGNVKADSFPSMNLTRFGLVYAFNHLTGAITAYEDLEITTNPLCENKPYLPGLLLQATHETAKLAIHRFGPSSTNSQREVLSKEYSGFSVENSRIILEPSVTRTQYIERVKHLQEKIRCGDVYQANIAATFHAELRDPLPFFLSRFRSVRYAAYLQSPDFTILSFSPELFFTITPKKGNLKITGMPIKGTARRGSVPSEDQEIINRLRLDLKERAELAMIVDLVRNDFSQISQNYQVSVKDLFKVTSYEHLHHLDATITGILKEVTFFEILHAVYPAGSISGAPKRKAIEFIDELEDSPRGIWTGSIIFTNLANFAFANVAIRSGSVIDNRLTFKSGCGITLKSQPDREYDELLLKTKVWGHVRGTEYL